MFKVLLLSLLISIPTHAGFNVENGGNGIIKNGKLYSLDLAEFGLEENPFYDDEIEAHTGILILLKEKLPGFSPGFRFQLARKITRIQTYHPYIFRVVLKALHYYKFYFVDFPLRELDDDVSPFKDIVRIASHNYRYVRINRENFTRLEENNKPALILHEIIYAGLDRDEKSTRSKGINAYFFDKKYAKDSFEDQYELGLRYYPKEILDPRMPPIERYAKFLAMSGLAESYFVDGDFEDFSVGSFLTKGDNYPGYEYSGMGGIRTMTKFVLNDRRVINFEGRYTSLVKLPKNAINSTLLKSGGHHLTSHQTINFTEGVNSSDVAYASIILRKVHLFDDYYVYLERWATKSRYYPSWEYENIEFENEFRNYYSPWRWYDNDIENYISIRDYKVFYDLKRN